jgi:HAD superfamily hydrolase (TIGR01509 family)
MVIMTSDVDLTNHPDPAALRPAAMWLRYDSRADGWTPGRRAAFLTHLADNGVVAEAAAAVGKSLASAYALRRRAGGYSFNLGWEAALLLARRRVADELMTAAIKGETAVWTREEGKTTYTRFNPRTALALLDRVNPATSLNEVIVVAQHFDRFRDLIDEAADLWPLFDTGLHESDFDVRSRVRISLQLSDESTDFEGADMQDRLEPDDEDVTPLEYKSMPVGDGLYLGNCHLGNGGGGEQSVHRQQSRHPPTISTPLQKRNNASLSHITACMGAFGLIWDDTIMAQLRAVIFGAIGVIAETSDLQRQSFNLAFAEAGLDWVWDVATYRDLLSINGGQERLRVYRDADANRSGVSDALITVLHDRKTALYAGIIKGGSLAPRSGVAALMAACKAAGVLTAFCTSTSRDNVDAIAGGLLGKLDFADFASITTIDKIARVKPAPDAYLHCLGALGLTAQDVVAIEDTPVSIASALAAGIRVIATPGAMTADQDFSGAALVVPDLALVTLADLQAVLDEAPRR